jgi:hypothetical protein
MRAGRPPVRRIAVTLAGCDVSHLLGGEMRRVSEQRRASMAEYIQVWRANVAEGSVKRLLELEPAAIAEAQRLCPDLLGANLVHLEDGTWLHVLRWSRADGEERLMAHADKFDVVEKMHALLEDAEQVGRGEIVTGMA